MSNLFALVSEIEPYEATAIVCGHAKFLEGVLPEHAPPSRPPHLGEGGCGGGVTGGRAGQVSERETLFVMKRQSAFDASPLDIWQDR